MNILELVIRLVRKHQIFICQLIYFHRNNVSFASTITLNNNISVYHPTLMLFWGVKRTLEGTGKNFIIKVTLKVAHNVAENLHQKAMFFFPSTSHSPIKLKKSINLHEHTFTHILIHKRTQILPNTHDNGKKSWTVRNKYTKKRINGNAIYLIFFSLVGRKTTCCFCDRCPRLHTVSVAYYLQTQ